MAWACAKEEGNQYFANRRYNDAIEKYSYAIQILASNPELSADLARVYSNRSAAYLQMGLTFHDSERTECFRHSLADGHNCIAADSDFEKGHFRVAKALLCLNYKGDGLDHITKIIELHRQRKTDYRQDKVLAQLMKDYKYWQQRKVLRSYQVWDKVKYKDKCFVIDPYGAGDMEHIQSAINMMSRVSLLVLPGAFLFREKGILIKPQQDIDIVGLCHPGEETAFETPNDTAPQGVIFDHTVTVVNGILSMTNITVRQQFNHAERHAILVVKGGKCMLNNCKFWSKASGSIAATDPGSKLVARNCVLNESCGGIIVCGQSKVVVDQCQITNVARIGVEIRDGGFLTMRDTEVSNSGRQGLVCHAYGEGFHLQRCKFMNNACHFGENEAAISVATGKVSVAECEILNNKGTGLGLDSGSHCILKDSQISGSKVALSLCHGCTAHITNNKLINNRYGLTILFNLGKDIVLQGNTIEAALNEIILTKEDSVPKMTGAEHKVEVFQIDIGEQMLSEKLKILRKQKKLNKFDENNRPASARDERVPTQMRVCPGCGLDEEAKRQAFKKCSACKVTFYCSADCQKKDWEMHKNQCRLLKEAQH